jgi:hypothetical protein
MPLLDEIRPDGTILLRQVEEFRAFLNSNPVASARISSPSLLHVPSCVPISVR